MSKAKILIVEDETIVARDLKKSVEQMGYFVCAIASSGEEAVQKADETRPDLILMDIVLKGDMDGIRAAEQIKTLFKIPIVYLTAYDDEDILQRAKITTPYGYITKPFNDRELHIAIEIALYKSQAEAKIRKTELWLAAVLRSVGDGVIASDTKGRITFMNQMAEKLTGWKQEDALGKKLTEVLNIKDEELGGLGKHLVEKVITQGLIINLLEDRLLVAKDGTVIPISDSMAPIRDDDGETPGTVLVFRDISERKKAEEALQESEARYRAVAQSANDAIITVNSDGAIMGWNLSAERMFGYPEAEVLGQSPVLVVPHQFRERHRDGLKRVQAGGESRVIGKTVELDGLRKDGSEFPLELSLSQCKILDGHFYTGIIRDITERKKAEESLKETLESLRKAVGATIQVMVTAVETRDPYTSGHQTRSADLARAIATEMGLPHEIIDAIRIAGSIHDIGKLSIPAEILSKPTKLSEIEFSLIKEHAHKGFEMLKDVESPWPLAEIVRQHHERMDGSGYPRNLKGEEILIEARILAVADVVEAMASHRPYRPGLGIDAALNEIEKNRGIFYDNTVADVCLRLFREKGFQMT